MGLIIEGGIYFLLLFTPIAFGGVEMWAQGVFQIVAGLVVAAWLWTRLDPGSTGSGGSSPTRGRMIALRVSIALFVLLILFQLVPLPPAWVQRISAGTHDLYARALPGYAEGIDFDAERLPSWLMARHQDRIPQTVSS